MTSTGGMNFNAMGGQGLTSGGAGGGGRIHIQAINQVVSMGTSNATVAYGVGGDTANSTVGTCYAQNITFSGCP